MIILAVLTTIAAIIGSALVVLANGMSDAPMAGFQGAGMLIAVWLGVAVLWLAWWYG